MGAPQDRHMVRRQDVEYKMIYVVDIAAGIVGVGIGRLIYHATSYYARRK